MEVGTSFAASIEAMGAEKAQVSFLNTLSALLAASKYGVYPVLLAIRKYSTNDVDPDAALKGEPEPFYKGQFIASVDSGVTELCRPQGQDLLLGGSELDFRLRHAAHRSQGQRDRPGRGLRSRP